MTERLLQFIWQFQHFNRSNLRSSRGDSISIIHPGSYNVNQGPDFSDARLKVNDTLWAGNIELHTRSSDWTRHAHGTDSNYHNIILHVVWQHDQVIQDGNGAELLTLELANCVPKVLLDKYEWLMMSQDFVPCQNQLPVLSDLSWLAWKERVAIERLQRKAAHVLELLVKAGNHWEEVFWWMLAGNFGVKVNSSFFKSLAQTLPLNILTRHKNQIHQLEALLLGQSGLLSSDFNDDYPILLQREYRFLQKKYSLVPLNTQPFFLRMRPANFPTIRLAQLAMLVHQSNHLFSKVKEAADVKSVKEFLNVTANDYWHYHYRFDELGEHKPKQLGIQMADNIIINTIVPVLFAYALFSKDEELKERALQWLTETAAEKNNITTAWKTFGVTNNNALESQALIELKNNYCNQKRCLECAVGNGLLKPGALSR